MSALPRYSKKSKTTTITKTLIKSDYLPHKTEVNLKKIKLMPTFKSLPNMVDIRLTILKSGLILNLITPENYLHAYLTANNLHL